MASKGLIAAKFRTFPPNFHGLTCHHPFLLMGEGLKHKPELENFAQTTFSTALHTMSSSLRAFRPSCSPREATS